MQKKYTGRILKYAAAALAAIGMVSAAGCSAGEKQSSAEAIKLSVWCTGGDVEMVQGMVDEFKQLHSDEASFEITISAEKEDTCKQTVLTNPQAAADIYTFAADQFLELYNAGALLEITENTDAVIDANGGDDSGAIRAASADGRLYAYPLTSGNGYFLYYNSEYYTKEDIESMDRILEIAAENGKKVAMDFTSGWYIYSFFKGAGLNVGMNSDGISNYCDWNSTVGKYSGVDVAEAMLAIARNEGFISCKDEELVKGAQDGTIIAAVNGTWNDKYFRQAYGDGYAAAKLPEFTIAGNSEQMCSFAGYKLIGVNAYSDSPQWSMRLADWLTNEENQMKRFRINGECPSNVNAAASPEVKASPAISAQSEQAVYGTIQNVADQFWSPSYLFGTTIAAKNVDEVELQALLDTMVEGITAPPIES